MNSLHKETIDKLEALENKGALPHGFIFFGPRGTGKAKSALELARRLERGSKIKDEKPGGRGAGSPLLDAKLINPEGGESIGIDEVRELQEFLKKRPALSARRTVIVYDASRLTGEAQNAFLKIAEEPPEAGFIILIIQDPELLWPTLSSRFQKIYFPPVSEAETEQYLREEAGFGETKAKKYAKAFKGAPELAVAVSEDENFNNRAKQAKEFLDISPGERKNFLKAMVEDEDFNFPLFLDALILAISVRGPKKYSNLWHSVVDLRGLCDITNPSPKIQINYLWTLF